jgi:hypothetical protein
MDRVYKQIASTDAPGVICPVFAFHSTARRFHTALNRIVQRLNPKLDVTVRYEGALRWSMMGTVLWLEFELVDAGTFSVTELLHGTTAKCLLRRQTKQMEVDVRRAIKQA